MSSGPCNPKFQTPSGRCPNAHETTSDPFQRLGRRRPAGARRNRCRSGLDEGERALLETAALLSEGLRPLRQVRPSFQAQLQARLLGQLSPPTTPWWRRLVAVRSSWPLAALPRGLAGALAVLLITFLLAGALVAASSVLRVQRPEDGGARDATSDVLVRPLLPPPGALVYWRVDPPTAAQETGRALAYLPQPPTGLDEPVEVALPALSALSKGEVAIRTNALVHYQGGGHSVFIALDEPSATIAQQQQRLLLGQRTIQLADGREAWASFRPQWPESNVVATAMDRFLVVVASDLPAPMVQNRQVAMTQVRYKRRRCRKLTCLAFPTSPGSGAGHSHVAVSPQGSSASMH